MCLGTQNFNCTKQGFSIMSQLHICVKSSFPRSCIKSYSKLWLDIFTLKRLQGLHPIPNTRLHLGLIKTIWTQWGSSSMSSNIGRGCEKDSKLQVTRPVQSKVAQASDRRAPHSTAIWGFGDPLSAYNLSHFTNWSFKHPVAVSTKWTDGHTQMA